MGVNQPVVTGCRCKCYGSSEGGTVLGCRMVSVSRWNWQSRGMMWRGLWKVPEKRPVRSYMHVFFWNRLFSVFAGVRRKCLVVGATEVSAGQKWIKKRILMIGCGSKGEILEFSRWAEGRRAKSCKLMKIAVFGWKPCSTEVEKGNWIGGNASK